MPENKGQRDIEVLSDAAQIKVLAHKDRLAMLSELSREALSGAQLADRLNMPANRAQYHLHQLLDCALIREVGRGRKRWKEERFFGASARHYVVDPNLACDDDEATRRIQLAIDNAFTEWRQREVLNIDFGRLAREVVGRCVGVESGDRVLVMFDPASLEFAEALMVELEAIEARPRLKVWSRQGIIRTLDRHNVEELERRPFFHPADTKDLSALIWIATPVAQGPRPSDEHQAKVKYVMQALAKWDQGLRERGIPYLMMALLQRGALADSIVPTEVAMNAYWSCVDTDYVELTRRARAIMELVANEPNVHVHTDDGTDLTVEVDVTKPYINDGVISKEDLKAGRNFKKLPAGSLLFLPKRGSANGTIVAPYTFIGYRYNNVRVEVRDGEIQSLDADNDADRLRTRVFETAGEPRQMSVVGLGLNPAATGLTGVDTLDGCIEGIVELEFGNNQTLGGDVRSTVTVGLPLETATIDFGSVRVIERGSMTEAIRG